MKIVTVKSRKDFLKSRYCKYYCSSSSVVIKRKINNKSLIDFGITISKKVSKKAVVRNKIRRQIKSILRDVDAFLLKTGCSYFINVRSNKADYNFSIIKRDIIYCLNVIKKNDFS